MNSGSATLDDQDDDDDGGDVLALNAENPVGCLLIILAAAVLFAVIGWVYQGFPQFWK